MIFKIVVIEQQIIEATMIELSTYKNSNNPQKINQICEGTYSNYVIFKKRNQIKSHSKQALPNKVIEKI